MNAASFVVPRWLKSNHLQTLGATFPLWAPPRDFAPAQVQDLRLPLAGDGALHACAWWHADPAPRPTAIVVHGVGGSSESHYVVRAAVSLYRAGWQVVRLNLRGAGDSIPDSPSLYHAGLTEDLRVAIAELARRPEVRHIALVGFSLGGHVIARLVGEVGSSPPTSLAAAVAISAPLDLVAAASAILNHRRLPYHFWVLRGLVQRAEAFAQAHPERAHYDVRALRRLHSIRAFDERVVAPMHGFAGADDYYARASAAPLVSSVRIPTLLVHAEDDPMVPAASVRRSLESASTALEVCWSSRGGHIGWLAGLSESSWVNTWAMEQTLDFLARMT